MLFFKSKKDKGEKEKTKKQTAADPALTETDSAEVVSDTPSLFEVDKLLFKNGYKVYGHDQGRKSLDKRMKTLIK